jgi:hypothetical protein
MNDQTAVSDVLIERIERLERQNRRIKFAGGAAILMLGATIALGFQPAPAVVPTTKRVEAEEIQARTVFADSFVVRGVKGEFRIDRNGLFMSAPGTISGGRTNIIEFENRIMIGMDDQWLQQNALGPTPRISVGRWGKDTGNNQVTRITYVSPEGLHSGEWHTNNPGSPGRTDRDLIESAKRK